MATMSVAMEPVTCDRSWVVGDYHMVGDGYVDFMASAVVWLIV